MFFRMHLKHKACAFPTESGKKCSQQPSFSYLVNCRGPNLHGYYHRPLHRTPNTVLNTQEFTTPPPPPPPPHVCLIPRPPPPLVACSTESGDIPPGSSVLQVIGGGLGQRLCQKRCEVFMWLWLAVFYICKTCCCGCLPR